MVRSAAIALAALLGAAAGSGPEATAAPGDANELTIPAVPGAPGCAFERIADDGTIFADDVAWHPTVGIVDPDGAADLVLVDAHDDTALYRRTDVGGYLVWSRGRESTVVNPPASFEVEQYDGPWFAGREYRDDGLYPGVWSPATGLVPVTAALKDRFVVDVNAHGDSILQGTTTGGRVRAYLWRSSGAVVALGNPFGSGIDVYARAINDDGLVVGYTESTTGGQRAWSWRAGGVITPLGPADAPSRALLVNERGSIAGITSARLAPGTFEVPFLWTERRGFAVAALPMSPLELTEHDQVVGIATQVSQATVWDPIRGHLFLTATQPSFAYDMNDSGRVVGCRGTTATAWDVRTVVRADWSPAEVTRLAQLRDFFGYDSDEELLRFGVLVLAFINAIDPQPTPTPVVLEPPGSAASTVISWDAADMGVLNAVERRWVLGDEDAHRWGFLVLSFIAAIQGH